MRACVAAVVVASTVAMAAPALAVEREQRVGVDLGGAMLVPQGNGTPEIGGSAGAHWAYGLTDAFNLMAEGAWSLVSLGTRAAGSPRTLPAWIANADVGVAYVLDVLQWVPYAGLLFGGYAFAGGTIDGAKLLPGAAIALGLDYRIRPHFTVGVAVRQHFVSETNTYPSFTQAFARLEYTWGW